MNENEHAAGDGERADDELLTIRCQLGEQEAFDELIGRWNTPLWRYLVRMSGNADTARDLAQEVWLRVLRSIHRVRDGSRLRPWLFTIARRVVVDRLRERYATPPLDDLDGVELPDAGIDEERRDDIAAVDDALRRIPLAERDVLTLFYLRDLSLAEVAEVTGAPVGTVKSRLFRARQLLKRELARRGVTA